MVFWSLSCYKELKLTMKPFTCTGRTLCGLLIQIQTISLWTSGMHRRQIFEISFGLKSDTRVLTFTFRFLFFPLFLLFLPHFFSFAGHLVDFILVGKVFRKAFRIFRINCRSWWERSVGSGTRFSWKFSGQCYMVFCLFLLTSVLDWIVPILVWFERCFSLYTT